MWRGVVGCSGDGCGMTERIQEGRQGEEGKMRMMERRGCRSVKGGEWRGL